jgi:hypothetical protein
LVVCWDLLQGLLLRLQSLCIPDKEHIIALLQHGPYILGIDQWEQDRRLVDRVWDQSCLKGGGVRYHQFHRSDRGYGVLV